MNKYVVSVNKLNIRRSVPYNFGETNSIRGVLNKGAIIEAEEIKNVPNPNLGQWFRGKDNNFYWGGGLSLIGGLSDPDPHLETEIPCNLQLEYGLILPAIKKKVEQVVNVFETGSAEGNYAMLVKYRDYNDPETKTRIVQVTYGRSQTTEFGHLKDLVRDYTASNGKYGAALQPYLSRLGKKPSLAGDEVFCNLLKSAGKEDPVMKRCQDHLFDAKYYTPSFAWFEKNGFKLPLSLLVIYDSFIHSGGILGFLRQRFKELVPESGGDEKSWIKSYVDTRHNWLKSHSSELLQKTIYRTQCFKNQMEQNNWQLEKPIHANGVTVS